jgi:uncharacterized protein YeaO (DUF488 family)
MIRVERVYERVKHKGGKRLLVDRLWPRGVKKSELRYDDWLKDVAPSDSLRVWFKHDPNKWNEFKVRYFNELDQNPGAWKPILDAAKKNDVTLLFSAKDETYNNATALKVYLESKL